ncbi:MAG: pyrroloquinoline quinone-dependent dehydrogenase [Proteobacteria bacterium]|nr:MAG: pyrroloquinoline quinone-dependent dehydrogenase [Pseudomonadota bacterium]
MTRSPALLAIAALALAVTAAAGANDWPVYAADAGGSRHSPLADITRENVGTLREAWRIRTGDLDVEPPPPRHMAFQATPILVNDLLVLPTPLGRVLALDPASGAERWRFDASFEDRRFPEFTSRGVAAWTDANAAADAPCRVRVFAATVESRLFAIDAANGQRCAGFGANGEVSLKEGVGEIRPWEFTISSPPLVAGDLVVVGSAMSDNKRVDMPRGIVRGYDARSGRLVWAWDPIPRSGEDPAFREWQSEQAARVGAANAWSILSYDAARDLVFVPTSSPSPDYFGGERIGGNRYANSVVALRAKSGSVAWHFQTVHHDLWDYDVPAQPVLAELMHEGRLVPVVVQATKMGFLFVLHRDTGAPVFPVEERPVPASDVPGEAASPTQPFPTHWPVLIPQTLAPEDAWGVTPFDRKSCREKIAALRNEGIYTPPSLQGTLMFPGNAGGTNWGSVAIEPKRRIAVLNQSNLPFVVRLIPRAAYDREKAVGKGAFELREFAPQEGTPYALVRYPLQSPLQLPCNPPPWGTLAAVELDTGKLLWQVPLGTVPDLLRVPLPVKMGLPNLGGPLVTAGGVVFIGAAMDSYLRAFDVETGAELWSDRLPAGGNANPMTYRARDGRQYVVIAAGGHGKLGTRRGDWVVAYALPRSR